MACVPSLLNALGLSFLTFPLLVIGYVSNSFRRLLLSSGGINKPCLLSTPSSKAIEKYTKESDRSPDTSCISYPNWCLRTDLEPEWVFNSLVSKLHLPKVTAAGPSQVTPHEGKAWCWCAHYIEEAWAEGTKYIPASDILAQERSHRV